jgi:uncharacterized damage-inducible protein DinB
MISRPQPDEYSAFAATYVNMVGDEPILEILESLQETTYKISRDIDPAKANFAYAPGKWTVKQVLGHMADTERIFAYRALVFSRESITLPGFDQDLYMQYATFGSRTLDDIAGEFKTIRQSSLYLLRSMAEEQTMQKGIASGGNFSVRAYAYMMAGHEMHHLKILRERYL